MKGLTGELGEMKIPLKLDAIPIRHRPYWLNPVYKKKVKVEIDKMLEVGVIDTIEESKMDQSYGSIGKEARGNHDLCRLEETE
jgi:hypothetical protein